MKSFLKLHFNIFGFLYCGHARSIVTDLNCGKCMPFRANCIAKDMAYIGRQVREIGIAILLYYTYIYGIRIYICMYK